MGKLDWNFSKKLTATVSPVCDLDVSYVEHSLEIHDPPGGWCVDVVLSVCTRMAISPEVTINSSVNTTIEFFPIMNLKLD